MAQEFTMNSQDIETKINQLLPSQGGFGAGVDFSASTMVIPIVDLTETAEGGSARADLQSALSFNSVTAFRTKNATDTIINTTGYYRIFGVVSAFSGVTLTIILSDGVSDKNIYNIVVDTNQYFVENFDFIVLCQAGDVVKTTSSNGSGELSGCTRQIADLQGNLVNP